MLPKSKNFAEAIGRIKTIDLSLDEDFERDDYLNIERKLNDRMIIISEINQMQKNELIPPADLHEIEEIWVSSNRIQNRILEKQSSVRKRLSEHEKNTSRGFAY